MLELGSRYDERRVMIKYNGTQWRIPVLTSLFAAMVLFSFFNDNHYVRLCAEANSTTGICPGYSVEMDVASIGTDQGDAAEAVNTYLRQWAEANPEYELSKGKDQTVRAFIVSAEGGGIRAAYWTAHVLAVLQERLAGNSQQMDFSRYVLAISGVSGGSLGGATYAATIAALREAQPGEANDSQDSINPVGFNFTDVAHSFLKQDFLAPTVSALMFPDLAQRLLPLPVFNDRAVAMEQSWERAWDRVCSETNGSEHKYTLCEERFKKPYDALWNGASSNVSLMPLLLLNSTVVATGKRLIMTPPQLQDAFGGIFNDAIDGRGVVGKRISLSTAVHLSARFTYVSPAGTVYYNYAHDKRQARQWLRLVDGGYFENSGAVTASEVLAAVERYNIQQDRQGPVIEPFVIHISNDPIKRGDALAPPNGRPVRFMGEVLPPLNALLHARPARGYQARQDIRSQAFAAGTAEDDDYRFVHFRLCDGDTPLPLGWTLSKKVRCSIERQFPAEVGRESRECANEVKTTKVIDPIAAAADYNLVNLARIQSFLQASTDAGDAKDGQKPEQLEGDLILACGQLRKKKDEN